MASKTNLNINKNLKKMMENSNMLLNKEIESLKDLQEIKKNPNMLPSKEVLRKKEDHKNPKEIIQRIFCNNKKCLTMTKDQVNKTEAGVDKVVEAGIKGDTIHK